MIQSQLSAHQRKLLDRREGVPYAVRVLLRRSRGLDLLEPGEDLDIEEVRREIPLQSGGTMPIVFRIIKRLYFPTPGYVFA
jgi:hypothetical protein